MKLSRSAVIPALIAVAVFALYPGAQAGNPPTWTNTPTQGPSPNNTHTVSGTACETIPNGSRVTPQGIHLVGGPPSPNTVTVRLFHPGPGAEIKNETFDANLDGTWSVVFEIPDGLAPGTYPLTAECNGFEASPREAAALAPVLGQPSCIFCFDYTPDRFYTVIAEADAPDPVEAEVTFTG